MLEVQLYQPVTPGVVKFPVYILEKVGVKKLVIAEVVVNPISTVKLLKVATVAEVKFHANSVIFPGVNPAAIRSDARYKFCTFLSVKAPP